MSGHRHTGIPESVLSAFLGFLPVGIVIGALYGLDVISLLALDLIFLGGLAVFVLRAVSKLDPRGLSEFGDESSER